MSLWNHLTTELKQLVSHPTPTGGILRGGAVTFADQVAPTMWVESFDRFQFAGDLWGRVYFIYDYPSRLSRRTIRALLDFGGDVWYSWFIRPLPPAEIHQALRQKRTALAASAIHDGERGSLTSYTTQAQIQATEEALARLEIDQGTIYYFGFYVCLMAQSEEELAEASTRFEDILRARDIQFHRAGARQWEGVQSILPLGSDRLYQPRNMDAMALACFFPFVRKTYFEPQGLLYGVHRHNGTWVVLDDFSAEHPNPLTITIGMVGMGKSVFLKSKMEQAVLSGHQVIALDLENEFRLLCEDLGGVYIELGRRSAHKLNILDLNPYDEDAFRSGLATFRGWVKLAIGRPLTALESNVIIPTVYERALREAGIDPDNRETWHRTPPRLSDISALLKADERAAARDLGACLFPYAEGLERGDFNVQTTVDLHDSPLVVFGLLGVEREMEAVRIYQVISHIWAQVLRRRKVPTHVIVDEAWHLLKRPGMAEELAAMSRRFRKHYGALHLATQAVEDFAASADAQVIQNNAATAVLFAQKPGVMPRIRELFGLTDAEASSLPSLGKGDALLVRGQTHIPIYIPVPPERMPLYTTHPRDGIETS